VPWQTVDVFFTPTALAKPILDNPTVGCIIKVKGVIACLKEVTTTQVAERGNLLKFSRLSTN
jgi:hypothetical protein